MPHIPVRDITMHYEVLGPSDGEPLVLLHGFQGRGTGMMHLAKPLAETYRVYVVDWRGHGETTNPGDPQILHSELGTDLAAFCDAVGIARAHFVGFSSGGMQQFPLVFARPDLVHTMTPVIATYIFDEHSQQTVSSIAARRREAIPSEAFDSEEARQRAMVMVNQWEGSVKVAGDLAYTPEQLKTIDRPMLIVHGDRDIFFRVHIPTTLYASTPNSELCILPNCGHGVGPSYRDFFLQILVDFLGRNPMDGASPS